MEHLVAEARRSGRLRAVTDAAGAVRTSDVSIICAGTPSKINGDLDRSFIERVTRDIGTALAGGNDEHLVMFRSTMLPGSVEDHLVPILEDCSGRRSGGKLHVAMCPEFLREAKGIEDFYRPTFTVVVRGIWRPASPPGACSRFSTRRSTRWTPPSPRR